MNKAIRNYSIKELQDRAKELQQNLNYWCDTLKEAEITNNVLLRNQSKQFISRRKSQLAEVRAFYALQTFNLTI